MSRRASGCSRRLASKVSVHYVDTLIDGTAFDSSRPRGEPAQFVVKQVTAGW